MNEYLEFWLQTTKTSIRPKTYEQYDQIVHQHINPLLGDMKLMDIKPDKIQAFYNNKLQSGTSERTVILIHAVLHRSLNQAMKLGLITNNPAQAVTRPRLKQKEMKILDDYQVRDLLLSVKGTKYEALYLIAITTGLRQGELLALKWNDLDWKGRKLKVQRQIQRLKDQGLVFSEPKTKAGRRVIALGKSTLEKLKEHYKLQEFERQVTGNRWVDNDLIFPSSVGTPQEASNTLKHFKQHLKASKLPDIRFHDLRHTAATLMLQQGIHPKVVQERLGHSNISLTLDTYSHVLPSMQEEAADKIDELLTPINVTSTSFPEK